ncbi:hypothetical protein CSTERTH_12030 [Thermoclostridium stercorarium subsp. thermolacticum DSM 2910]|uniref:DUF3810 domain-containing protein n=2 Tax=Thermoclostridium stercorarium TaxID=1510 RepID=A0A1B1YG42_THEST|nr:hypothetical protein CSTERTH_12030 [Thermoclostridium stercorarium subsp. thermolacticum DSM 2910]
MAGFSEKHVMNKKRKTVMLTLSAALLLTAQAVKRWASQNPQLVEKYFSRGIYPVSSKIQTSVANLFPFSLYELVTVILVIYGLYRIVRLVRSAFRREFIRELTGFFTLVILLFSIGIFLFQFLWNLNNYRLPLKDQLGLDVTGNSVEALADTYEALVLRANDIRRTLSDTGDTVRTGKKVKNILETAWEGYITLAEQYDLFHSQKVKVKGLIFSRIQTISGYTGVYSFITGEPNINTEPPLVTLPHTACHEIAHQMGITFEDEANYVAFLACKNHPDVLFQYSGYLSALTYTGNALYRNSPELYGEISGLLSESIKNDLREIRNFWHRYQKETATKIADRINETYLKSNNQPAGIQSYGKFVDLLIAHYLKNNSI